MEIPVKMFPQYVAIFHPPKVIYIQYKPRIAACSVWRWQ